MRLLWRILSILGVAALLGLVFLTLYLALTGSPYFMASLFAMIVVPVFIYGYMTILRILSSNQSSVSSGPSSAVPLPASFSYLVLK